ncbi:MAG: hypothetical protein COA52_12060 [Hyphomicrobiales bacterium]|nr:MAG: hypothetical protein COA52_12060 [Hyphomicrobiales bacterium]
MFFKLRASKQLLLSTALVSIFFTSVGGANAVVQTITGDTTGAPIDNRVVPNGSNTPTTLANNSSQHREHTITVFQGSTYRFETVAPTAFDTFLVLYSRGYTPSSPLTNVVVANDDIVFGINILSRILTGPLNAGSYTIVVTSYDAAYYGAYTLEIECLTNCFDLGEELRIQAAAQGIVLSKAQNRAIIQNLQNRFFGQNGGDAPLLGYADEGLPTASDIAAKRWSVWAEASGSVLDGNTGVSISGHQLQQQFGFDYMLNNNVIVGMSFGAGQFNVDAGSTEFVDGVSYFVQPYIGFSSDGWLATLQAGYTYTDYDEFDLSPAANDVLSAKGDRFTVSASVSKKIDFDGDFSLTPEVRAIYGHEKIRDIDGPSGPLADETAKYFFTSASLELSRGLGSDTGFGKAYPRAGIEYVDTDGDGSSAALSTDFHSESISGAVALGVQYEMVSGFNVSGELKAGGLGSDIASYGGNLRLGYAF